MVTGYLIIIGALLLLANSSGFGFVPTMKYKIQGSRRMSTNSDDTLKVILAEIAEGTRNNTRNIASLSEIVRNTSENIQNISDYMKNISEISQKEITTMATSIQQLTSYNQNRDTNLEDNIAVSLKRHILEYLKVPEEYLFEYNSKRIYSPKTGETSSEWDAIFLVDYSEKPMYIYIHEKCPPQNTVFFLEVKQNLNFTDFSSKLDLRVNKTRDAINEVNVSRKKAIQRKVCSQVGFFMKEPKFIVAVGSRNMNSSLTAEVADLGCIAFGPSGEDFCAVSKSYKIFL